MVARLQPPCQQLLFSPGSQQIPHTWEGRRMRQGRSKSWLPLCPPPCLPQRGDSLLLAAGAGKTQPKVVPCPPLRLSLRTAGDAAGPSPAGVRRSSDAALAHAQPPSPQLEESLTPSGKRLPLWPPASSEQAELGRCGPGAGSSFPKQVAGGEARTEPRAAGQEPRVSSSSTAALRESGTQPGS